MSIHELQATWTGPHDWPRLRQKSTLDGLCGVYLMTVEAPDGYLMYGAGISKSMRKRFIQHRAKLLHGGYTMFDFDAMRQGIRKEVWHGLWSGWDSDERKAEFKQRTDELHEAAERQMTATKMFAAEISDRRIQHRMEAGLMSAMYAAPKPFCDLPDRGMFLSSKWENEAPIKIINQSDHRICFLPKTMEI